MPEKIDAGIVVIEGGATYSSSNAAFGMLKGKIMRTPGRKGLDPEQSEGMTPLHWAVLSVENERVRKLINHGADVNAENVFGYTPLHISMLNGNIEAAVLLLEKGADVGAIDHLGTTPLHLAARRGMREAVEMLISKGADPRAEDNLGLTPIRWSHEDITDLLNGTGK